MVSEPSLQWESIRVSTHQKQRAKTRRIQLLSPKYLHGIVIHRDVVLRMSWNGIRNFRHLFQHISHPAFIFQRCCYRGVDTDKGLLREINRIVNYYPVVNMGIKIRLRDVKLGSLFLLIVVDPKPSEHITVTTLSIAVVWALGCCRRAGYVERRPK